MWIQCNSAGVVLRIGNSRVNSRPNTTDYQVQSIPQHVDGDILSYDGTAFSIDSTRRIADAKAALEPKLLTAHARWQSAVTLNLDCAAHCQAKYEALRAEYDAL